MSRSHELGAFLAMFGLNEDQLPRLALFLLGHSLIDRWLIHFLAVQEMRPAIRAAPPQNEEALDAFIDKLVTKHSAGTFLRHLRAVQEVGLPDELTAICEEMNQGRDHFLHWQPGRFSVPRYRGLDVTTQEGLDRCLRDVFRVIRTIVGEDE
jgi:hypothetical protein